MHFWLFFNLHMSFLRGHIFLSKLNFYFMRESYFSSLFSYISWETNGFHWKASKFMRNEFILCRPSNTSTQHQTRMSASDLRGVGISAPTGFVHVSGYSNRSGSIAEVPSPTQPMNVVQLRDQGNNRTSRMRELSNIDPKFTSQVSHAPIILPISAPFLLDIHKGCIFESVFFLQRVQQKCVCSFRVNERSFVCESITILSNCF